MFHNQLLKQEFHIILSLYIIMLGSTYIVYPLFERIYEMYY